MPIPIRVTLAVLLLAASTLTAAASTDPIALMEAGHFKQARPLIDARVASTPDDPATLYLRARMMLIGGDAKAALPIAERAATLAPRNADYRYQVAECVGTMAQHAGALKGLGLAKRFKREAEAVLAIDARHVDAHEGLIEFYSVAPGIAGGDDKRALQLAENLVGIAPAPGHLAQATLAFRAKHEPEGEAALRQAVAADPASYRAHVSLARYLATDTRKAWDEAEQQARAAIAIEPGRVGAWAVLAYLQAHRQQWDPLEQTLTEAEKAVPDNLVPWYQAGRTLIADDREPARAERYIRKYLTQEPEVGGPSFAHAHWRLGLAIEKQGRAPEARSEIEAALKLNPELDDAKKDLKRMKKKG
ncbi:MAG TPA: tetratricopeptide repeat protein [Candidatus Eisenbacteria bacterium]|nr:tetratricopeptide repeat protein [Candidatus Eisenbacteria bacterium]